MRDILYRVLRAAIALFDRNPWTIDRLELVSRLPTYAEDGLRTIHNHDFVSQPSFERAYARATQAGGRDYGIRWRVHTVLWAAATAARVPGAFVECGVGRGFMASAICSFLDWTDRDFFLFDTFEPCEVDPASGERLTARSPVYADGAGPVAENFRAWPGVQLVVGRVPESFDTVTLDRIAFLHVDLNHAPAEAEALRRLWPKLSAGGIVVFDDYGNHGYAPIHESADRLSAELGFEILTMPTGQGIAIKGPTA